MHHTRTWKPSAASRSKRRECPTIWSPYAPRVRVVVLAQEPDDVGLAGPPPCRGSQHGPCCRQGGGGDRGAAGGPQHCPTRDIRTGHVSSSTITATHVMPWLRRRTYRSLGRSTAKRCRQPVVLGEQVEFRSKQRLQIQAVGNGDQEARGSSSRCSYGTAALRLLGDERGAEIVMDDAVATDEVMVRRMIGIGRFCRDRDDDTDQTPGGRDCRPGDNASGQQLHPPREWRSSSLIGALCGDQGSPSEAVVWWGSDAARPAPSARPRRPRPSAIPADSPVDRRPPWPRRGSGRRVRPELGVSIGRLPHRHRMAGGPEVSASIVRTERSSVIGASRSRSVQ